ncbi:ATPase, AAA family protein [Aciduliprofundum boonei T469]|nr:ATPase, AAA family protein [Aciduliprofundum boonei T469]
MKVHEYMCGGKIGNSEEEVKYKEVIKNLKEHLSPIEIWTIANINFHSAQIDLLIIKDDALIIVDFKNIPDKKGEVLKIIGNESSEYWEGEYPDGRRVTFEKNYLKQLYGEYQALTKVLSDKIPKFKKVKDSYKNIHMLDVLCFNEGAKYDYGQIIDRRILRTFKVATPAELPEIVKNYSSEQYQLTKDEILEIINLFEAENLDYEDEIEDLWNYLPRSPKEQCLYNEEIRNMKNTEKGRNLPQYITNYINARKKLQKICYKIKDINLKAECEHQLALTEKDVCKSLEDLMKIRNKYPFYEGTKKHNFIEDLIAYTSYTECGEGYPEINQIYEEIISKWPIEKRYKLWRDKIIEEGFVWWPNSFYTLFGRDLAKYYPNDYFLNFFELVYYWEKKDYENTAKIFKKIVLNPNFIKKFNILTFDEWESEKAFDPGLITQEYRMDAFLSFFDEKMFFDIMNSVKEKYPEMLPDDLYNYYVASYYYWKFVDTIQDNKEINKELLEHLKESLEVFEQMIKKDSKESTDLLRRIINIRYFAFHDNCEKVMDLFEKLISSGDATLLDYKRYGYIAKKYQKNKNCTKIDNEYIFSILRKGLKKYPTDLDLITILSVEYTESGLKGKALNLLESFLIKKIKTYKSLQNRESDKEIKKIWEELGIENDEDSSGENKGERIKSIASMFGKRELNLLEMFIKLSIELREWDRMLNIFKSLESFNFIDTEDYLSKGYLEYGKWLVKRYGDIVKEKKEEDKESKENVEKRITLEDVILDEETMEEIRDIIEDVRDGEATSVLFYGPPGVGKTRIAEAMAGELGYELIKITPSEILSKWVGESEKNLKEYFDKAKNGRVVLFIDEIDGLGNRREASTNTWEITFINQFMQSVEDLMKNGNYVLLIGATNYIDRVDRALIRPGRFNEKIEIKPPDSELRAMLFKYYVEKLAKDRELEIPDDMDWYKFGEVTNGLTGADISTLILKRLKRLLRKENKKIITTDDILKVLMGYKVKNNTMFKNTEYIQ